MHFIKGKRTYAFLVIGLIAAVLTLTSADDVTLNAPEATDAPTPSAATIMKCAQCNSKDSTDCLDANKLTATACTDDTFTKCYTKSDGGVITRGCLKPDDNGMCPDSNCKACTASDTSACNNQNICKKCATTDPKCSQTDVSDASYNDICDGAATKCFVNVKDKLVERRCAASGDSCGSEDSTTTCNICAAGNCNVGIFPTKRIHCYQCSDSSCSDVSSKAELTMPCLNYVETDACYMTADSATSVQRGCKSDESSKCSAGTEKGCLTCNTDNCNNSPYEKNQALKCIQCSGPDCFKEQDVTTAQDCSQKIAYNAEESCYTLAKDGAVQRGCLHDNATIAEECGTEGSSCKKCTSPDGCNKQAESNEFTCIVCRSDIEKNCWNDAGKVDAKLCRTGESSEAEGCFHGIWYGVAIRGCFIDADPQMQEICTDVKNYQCERCTGKNCNKNDSSGAQSVTVYIGLLALMTTTILWYLN